MNSYGYALLRNHAMSIATRAAFVLKTLEDRGLVRRERIKRKSRKSRVDCVVESSVLL